MLVEESKNPMFHVYRMEEEKPTYAHGILPLVSIRDNETARMLLGLDLGKSYKVPEVLDAFDHMAKEAQAQEPWEFYIVHRLDSCVKRLFYFDPLVEMEEIDAEGGMKC